MNSIKKIHSLISFSNLFRLLLGFAVTVQIIIITANHISGYSAVDNYIHFISRLFFGSSLSLIAVFAIAYPDLFLIHFLNKTFPWEKRTLSRILIHLVAGTLLAVIISIFITLLSHSINPYKEGVFQNLIYNALIFSVCNIILISVLEGWIFFIESSVSKRKSEKLEGQLSQLRFEVLKKQINSHFMFNSLNVLSSLIENDKNKAQVFIDEFASIYRYVLESIEEPVVKLSEEIQFARSYLFLQQIRYGEHLSYNIDLPSHYLTTYIPPLSLQVVLENVCKHNLIHNDRPLYITISAENDSLIIKNNLQPKTHSDFNTGTGQTNLTKRYSLISNRKPDFRVATSYYIVSLPLIFEDN